MQLVGGQFTSATAIAGNDLITFPDFPAEIRAPAGTVAGVSGFQLNFASSDVYTPGDRPDVLVAMNPAALKANIDDLKRRNGILIVNKDSFTEALIKKAGYTEDPLPSLKPEYQVFEIPLTTATRKTLEDSNLSQKEKDRCKNFFALGLMYWLFHRPLEPTIEWIKEKFAKKEDLREANAKVLKAGYYFGETTEIFAVSYKVLKAKKKPGRYRNITGNSATGLGLIAASKLSGLSLFYGSYPITPASDILHMLASHAEYGVTTFQAEDEIAAVCSAIGASFAGNLGVTGTSGPGLALKTEAVGLAVMTELPLIIINVQRGGPSTGLPTKTEQADLNQALFGRNGECPVCILAPATPGECFDMAIESFRIATEYMVPVIMLTDGYLANGAEPWRIPDVASLPKIEVKHPAASENGFLPYARDAKLARPWALPGTPGLQHRIGGLEKADGDGNVCYDPENHEHMIHTRQKKVEGIAETIPPTEMFGDDSGELLVVGWGSTYGAITSAVERCRAKGMDVSSIHIRYLYPMPKDIGAILKRFKKVMVPEMNLGQLVQLLRAKFLVDAKGLNKVQGKPFMISDIERGIEDTLNGKAI
ncbi:MAG: 2-oxoacid:acceptor oxidoreductase subunit alpha [Planctomycetes bacterium]|nr:2-oxoacid:acceptor oxidoreductase subunit alpha [Planctomycetota bacterium]